MFWYDFSFRSLTAAQDGRSVLEHAGIGAELLRAPQAISEQGCGYVVETADFEGARAFEQFLANGVRFRRVFRRYENGGDNAAKAPAGAKNGGLRDGALREPWKRGISRGHAGLRRGL